MEEPSEAFGLSRKSKHILQVNQIPTVSSWESSAQIWIEDGFIFVSNIISAMKRINHSQMDQVIAEILLPCLLIEYTMNQCAKSLIEQTLGLVKTK